jgi:hypothetical protein
LIPSYGLFQWVIPLPVLGSPAGVRRRLPSEVKPRPDGVRIEIQP